MQFVFCIEHVRHGELHKEQEPEDKKVVGTHSKQVPLSLQASQYKLHFIQVNPLNLYY